MLSCPRCALEYPEGRSQCPVCWVDLEPAEEEGIRCPRCGHEQGVQGDVCVACGVVLVSYLKCDRHPDRPAVAQCLICTENLCEDCAVRKEGRRFCPEDGDRLIIGGWAEAFAAGDEFQAELVKGRLMSAGIPSQIYSQKFRMEPVNTGALGLVRVMVPLDRLQEAWSILREEISLDEELLP